MIKNFSKDNIVKEFLKLAYDMNGAESGENSVGFIQLPDGRTAEVSIRINADEDDFIVQTFGNKVFILKSRKMKPVELP